MTFKEKLHEIIFEADTKEGKLFDVVLLWLIVLSIILVMLESVKEIDAKYAPLFNVLDWIITGLFTAEYIARVFTIKKPLKYIFSFYGIIDLLATIPKYLSLVLAGTHFLVAIRAFRLLRLFRVLKMGQYMGASNNLITAIKASRTRISVFIFVILIICVLLGTVMYLIEGEESGFNSIPRSMYWAIVTLTTVGYGDIAPQTAFGQFIASIIMILGYGIIAIPTGIVTSEITKINESEIRNATQSCTNCSTEGHKSNAEFCFKCGHVL